MTARKRGPGRPAFKEGTAKTGVFAIRLSDEERGAIYAAAERIGKPVTQWARDTLLDASAMDATTAQPMKRSGVRG